MSFTKISREQKTWTSVTEVRFAVHKTPTALVGRVTLPPDIVKSLGWESRETLDVLVGDPGGDDDGWFSLMPSNENHRAKFVIRPNGVGRYTSKALVPDSVSIPQGTTTPLSRIDGDVLYMKLV